MRKNRRKTLNCEYFVLVFCIIVIFSSVLLSMLLFSVFLEFLIPIYKENFQKLCLVWVLHLNSAHSVHITLDKIRSIHLGNRLPMLTSLFICLVRFVCLFPIPWRNLSISAHCSSLYLANSFKPRGVQSSRHGSVFLDDLKAIIVFFFSKPASNIIE